MADIDREFALLERKRPNADDLFDEEDYIEEIEKSNSQFRDKIGELVASVKATINRVKELREDRNDSYIRPPNDNPEVSVKRKELQQLYGLIKLKATEISRLKRITGKFCKIFIFDLEGKSEPGGIVVKDIQNQIKTPGNLRDHLKTYDQEIAKLYEGKQALLTQLEIQNRAKQDLFQTPEFNSNIKALMEQIESEKNKFKTL